MGFSVEQVALLEKNLDQKHVKTRQQAGRDLSYVEGWHAIAEANRIFGFDGWDRETVYLKEVSRVEKNGKWKVGYEAKVRVSVSGDCDNFHGKIVREGTGFGQGTMGDLYDAMESAAKEAETDAMKRALMTFGNQFGLALYDKEQRNVGVDEKREKAEAKVKSLLTFFGDMDTFAIATWISEHPEEVASIKWIKRNHQDLYAELKGIGVEVE